MLPITYNDGVITINFSPEETYETINARVPVRVYGRVTIKEESPYIEIYKGHPYHSMYPDLIITEDAIYEFRGKINPEGIDDGRYDEETIVIDDYYYRPALMFDNDTYE
jgi:hypothetical protein